VGSCCIVSPHHEAVVDSQQSAALDICPGSPPPSDTVVVRPQRGYGLKRSPQDYRAGNLGLLSRRMQVKAISPARLEFPPAVSMHCLGARWQIQASVPASCCGQARTRRNKQFPQLLVANPPIVLSPIAPCSGTSHKVKVLRVNLSVILLCPTLALGPDKCLSKSKKSSKGFAKQVDVGDGFLCWLQE